MGAYVNGSAIDEPLVHRLPLKLENRRAPDLLNPEVWAGAAR